MYKKTIIGRLQNCLRKLGYDANVAYYSPKAPRYWGLCLPCGEVRLRRDRALSLIKFTNAHRHKPHPQWKEFSAPLTRERFEHEASILNQRHDNVLAVFNAIKKAGFNPIWSARTCLVAESATTLSWQWLHDVLLLVKGMTPTAKITTARHSFRGDGVFISLEGDWIFVPTI